MICPQCFARLVSHVVQTLPNRQIYFASKSLIYIVERCKFAVVACLARFFSLHLPELYMKCLIWRLMKTWIEVPLILAVCVIKNGRKVRPRKRRKWSEGTVRSCIRLKQKVAPWYDQGHDKGAIACGFD